MYRVLPYVFFALIGLLTVLPERPATAGDYYYNDYGYGAPVRYEGGYVDRPRYRYRSADCCYRRVVRYERTYRDYDRPYYSSRYDRPYYGDRYVTTRTYDSYERPYDRPYYRPYRPYRSAYYARPYHDRYVTTRYYEGYDRPYVRPYRSYYGGAYYGTRYYGARYYGSRSYYGAGYEGAAYRYGYGGNAWRYANQPRSFYPPGCRPARYKVYDDQGGWVWGKRAVC